MAHDPIISTWRFARFTRRIGIWCIAATVLTLGIGLHGAEEQTQADEQSIDPFLKAGREAPVDRIEWRQQTSLSFDNAAALDDFIADSGEWEIRDGALWATAGEKNRTILLGHAKGETVRITFDATNFARDDDRIGDISVLLNARPGRSATANGYALTTGSYFNTCTTFYREGEKLARTEYSPVVDGKRNRVVIELHDGHIRYWMNGEIILETWDTDPLTLDDTLHVGVRTYGTKMRIDNFTIAHPADEK